MTDHTQDTEYIEAVDLPPLFEPAPRQLSAVIMNEADAYRYMSREDARLSKIPEEFRSENVCTLAVQKDGAALRHVPMEHRSYWLCTEAVSNNGLALGYVPDEHRDYVMCSLAVESHGMALGYVPGELVTPELKALSEQHLAQAQNAHVREHAREHMTTVGLKAIEGGRTDSDPGPSQAVAAANIANRTPTGQNVRILTKRVPAPQATTNDDNEGFELPADLIPSSVSGKVDYETALTKAYQVAMAQKDQDRDRDR